MLVKSKAVCYLYQCGCCGITFEKYNFDTCKTHRALLYYVESFYAEEKYSAEFLAKWLGRHLPNLEKWRECNVRQIRLPANIVNQVRSTKYLYENSRSNEKEEVEKPKQGHPPSLAFNFRISDDAKSFG